MSIYKIFIFFIKNFKKPLKLSPLQKYENKKNFVLFNGFININF